MPFVSVENIQNLKETNKFISKADFEKYYPIKPRKDDILMTRIGDIGTPAIVATNKALAFYVSLALIRIISKEINVKYLFYYIQSSFFKRELYKRTIHNAFPTKINKNEIGKCIIIAKSLDRQKFISSFLSLLDRKMSLLVLKIQTLKTYRKGLMQKVLKLFTFCKFISLDKTCKVTTGKLDANAQIDNGKYKFFTCSKEDLLIDTYAFDMEAILVSGNGEVGLAKYYKGKFNAYQRTYVLYDFLLNPLFIKICIDSQINNVIQKETNKGAMPYIKLTTFSKVSIPMITKKESDKIGNLVSVIDCKIKCYEQIVAEISKFKSFCLNNMFI